MTIGELIKQLTEFSHGDMSMEVCIATCVRIDYEDPAIPHEHDNLRDYPIYEVNVGPMRDNERETCAIFAIDEHVLLDRDGKEREVTKQ